MSASSRWARRALALAVLPALSLAACSRPVPGGPPATSQPAPASTSSSTSAVPAPTTTVAPTTTAAPTTTTTSTLVPPAAVTYPVGTRVLPLADAARGRALPTTVWYPAVAAGADAAPAATGGPFPLVVFSHGLGAQPAGYALLAQAWAAEGYVVAAPQFPLSSQGAGGVTDVVNQPADVSFVVGEVLRLSAEPADPLRGLVDPAKVLAAGHSLGAITTAGLFTGATNDDRVKGGIILAGTAAGPLAQLANNGRPVLFVHGDADAVVPIAGGRALYEATAAPKAFVTLAGGDHALPYLGAGTPAADVVRGVTLAFLDLASAAPGSSAAAVRAAATVPGVSAIEDQLG